MAGPEPEPVSSAAATTPAPSAPVVLPKTSESDQLLKIRHSMSHVMAMAVQQLFPKARVTIGPWTETGFYYDFDNPDPFTEADLKAIKNGMIKIINKTLPLERVEVSRNEAEEKIKAQNEPYKLEILEGLQEPITLYTLGEDWWDLCAGPTWITPANSMPRPSSWKAWQALTGEAMKPKRSCNASTARPGPRPGSSRNIKDAWRRRRNATTGS